MGWRCAIRKSCLLGMYSKMWENPYKSEKWGKEINLYPPNLLNCHVSMWMRPRGRRREEVPGRGGSHGKCVSFKAVSTHSEQEGYFHVLSVLQC